MQNTAKINDAAPKQEAPKKKNSEQSRAQAPLK
jgi:hypothetical protein